MKDLSFARELLMTIAIYSFVKFRKKSANPRNDFCSDFIEAHVANDRVI